ncbi:MAG TPA: hypothetical protein VKS21_03345 [Spirochaetota bacterium]|nr:hypothetical protein [Spirochaetota bacterium]
MAELAAVFIAMVFLCAALGISIFSGRSLSRGRCHSKQHVYDQNGDKIHCVSCSCNHKQKSIHYD